MKGMKKIFALLLVFAMIVPTAVFASESDIITGHVVFEGELNSLSASAFVRDLTESPSDAVLILAAYDSSDNVVAASSASGVNKILKTDKIDASEAAMVRAFVWASDSKRVISEIAKNIESLDKVDVKIYVGGDLQTFDADGSCTYTGSLMGDGELEFPDIKVEVSDNSVDYRVWHDAENKQSVITVEYGQRQTETKNVETLPAGLSSFAGTVNRSEYSKTSKTYIVKYENGIYSNSSFVTDTECETANLSSATPIDVWKTTVELETGATSKEVTATITKVGTGNFDTGFLVIVPTADKEATEESEGSSAIGAVYGDDGAYPMTADYTTQTVKTTSKRSTATVATASWSTSDGTSTENLYSYEKSWSAGDNTGDVPMPHHCGETATLSDLYIKGNGGVYYLPDELAGYEFIPLKRRPESISGSEMSVKFTLTESADIYAVLRTTSKLTEVNETEAEQVTEVGTGPLLYWVNGSSSAVLGAPTIVWMVKNGYMDESMISGWNSEDGTLTSGFLKKDESNKGYTLTDCAPIRKVVNDGKSFVKLEIDEPDDYMNIKKYMNSWLDGTGNSIIENYSTLLTEPANARYSLRYFDTDITESGYAAANSIMSRKDDTSNIGLILSYPEALELKGAEVFAPYGGEWTYQNLGNELLEFKLKKTAEIQIYSFKRDTSSNGEIVEGASETYSTGITVNGTDVTSKAKVIDIADDQVNILWNTGMPTARATKITVLSANAGDTVVIPNNSGAAAVVVKPLD